MLFRSNESATEVLDSFKVPGSIHPKPRLDNPYGVTRSVIQSKQPVLLSDIGKSNSVNPELLGRYRSMFAVPLLLEDAVVGVLYLNGKTVRQLTKTERSLLSTLADQAASVIQRIRLYQRLRDSEATYHSLLDNIPQCVFRKDIDSRFTSGNDSFCRSVGKPLSEIIGKTDYDFYAAEDAKTLLSG